MGPRDPMEFYSNCLTYNWGHTHANLKSQWKSTTNISLNFFLCIKSRILWFYENNLVLKNTCRKMWKKNIECLWYSQVTHTYYLLFSEPRQEEASTKMCLSWSSTSNKRKLKTGPPLPITMAPESTGHRKWIKRKMSYPWDRKKQEWRGRGCRASKTWDSKSRKIAELKNLRKDFVNIKVDTEHISDRE